MNPAVASNSGTSHHHRSNSLQQKRFTTSLSISTGAFPLIDESKIGEYFYSSSVTSTPQLEQSSQSHTSPHTCTQSEGEKYSSEMAVFQPTAFSASGPQPNGASPFPFSASPAKSKLSLWRFVIILATAIFMYFLVAYAPASHMNLTVAYTLQTAAGYRPPHHPYYLYFAPPPLPQPFESSSSCHRDVADGPSQGRNHRRSSKTVVEGAAAPPSAFTVHDDDLVIPPLIVNRSDIVNAVWSPRGMIPSILRARHCPPREMGKESAPEENGQPTVGKELESTDGGWMAWLRANAPRLIPQGPPSIMSQQTSQRDVNTPSLFTDLVESSLIDIVSTNLAPVRFEIILVDEIRGHVSSPLLRDESDQYVFQREVVGTEKAKRRRRRRVFLELEPNVIQSAVMPSVGLLSAGSGTNDADPTTNPLTINCLQGGPPRPRQPCKFTKTCGGGIAASVDVTNANQSPTKAYYLGHSSFEEDSRNQGHTTLQSLVLRFLAHQPDIAERHRLSAALASFNKLTQWIDDGLANSTLRHQKSPQQVTVTRKFIRVIDTSSLFGTTRYAAKTHFTAPFQAAVDYVLATAFVSHTPIASFVSPNTVSFSHFLVGIMAGACFYLSTLKPLEGRPTTLSKRSNDVDDDGSETRLHRWRGTWGRMCIAWFLESPRRLTMAGCFLYCVRNWLDTVDGVLARNSSRNLNSQSKGHTVDMVADGLGCFAANLGLLFMLCRQERQLSPMFFNALYRYPMPPKAREYLWSIRKPLMTQFVAFWGLALPGISALVWELFMLKYTTALDVAIDDYDIRHFLIEQDFFVRLNWYLWALIGGDNIIFVFICAVGLGCLWDVVQLAFLFGYVSVGLLVVYSHVTWHRAVAMGGL